MGRKSKREELPEKPHRLTLAELAAYDDVCTDVMVDNAYSKLFKIRKCRPKYLPIRGVKEDDVPQILLHKLIVGKDLVMTRKALNKLPGLKRYRQSIRSKPELEQFTNHFLKYVSMYQTDCPWEVSTTNRYTITTYEAAVTARRRMKQGETIKYLVGTLVPLTVEESADLDITNRNFSIVVSSRKKNSSIFLGPARFANHDCDANGRLVTRGNDGMEVVAMKNIDVGDEITVSYGDDYFGPANVDCLCHTCEVHERNGWTSKEAFGVPRSNASTPELTEEIYASPKKRRRDADSISEASSAGASSSKKRKIGTNASKLHQSWTPPSSAASDVDDPDSSRNLGIQQPTNVELGLSTPLSSDLDVHASGSGTVSSEVEAKTSPGGSRLKRPSKIFRLDRVAARVLGRSPSAKVSEVPLSPPSTSTSGDATQTMPGPGTVIKIESVETTKFEIDEDTIVVQPLYDEMPSMEAEDASNLREGPADTTSQAVSTLTTTKITKLKSTPSVLPSVEEPCEAEAITESRLTIHPPTANVRIPGDYILTRKLLAQPHDRWIKCTNAYCTACFVQPNGYQTRRECPRCERHSMLYGFAWPKTDPDPRKLMERKKKAEVSAYKRQGRSGKGSWVEGGGDEEERVMDHRTVHRFLFPGEEREISRKGLLREAEKKRESGRWEAGTPEHGINGWSESVGREQSWSSTPEDGRRKSKRFVRDAVYADA